MTNIGKLQFTNLNFSYTNPAATIIKRNQMNIKE